MADARFDGLDAPSLAARLSLPQCDLHERVGSTMDLAHAAAGRGAAAGTLVLANEQVAGRGRGGRSWASAAGGGLWMTLIERPRSSAGLDVLSLRVGLHLAEALDALAGDRVLLKWPNDLYAGSGKLAGILIEARWRDQRVEWVAIGIGINVVPAPGIPETAGLAPGVSRLDALDSVIPALRYAAAIEGPLAPPELARFAARDRSVGRRVSLPTPGVVVGVGAAGELIVDTAAGRVACRTGSLVYAEDR